MFKKGLLVIMVVIAPNFLKADPNCSLCSERVLESQKFYENEAVSILYDYRPIIDGHCLIVPKRHVEKMHDMSSQELISIQEAVHTLFKAAQKTYGATSYLLLQKNGKAAGQSVSHVHFHFFPRKEGDYSELGLLARFYIAGFRGPVSQEKIDLHRNALSQEIENIQEPAALIEAQ